MRPGCDRVPIIVSSSLVFSASVRHGLRGICRRFVEQNVEIAEAASRVGLNCDDAMKGRIGKLRCWISTNKRRTGISEVYNNILGWTCGTYSLRATPAASGYPERLEYEPNNAHHALMEGCQWPI